MQTIKSEKLFDTANKLFPGGVNSPVRAFGAVGGTPRFMHKGEGAWVWDVDDNKYLDFCCSWGPLILGHANPGVVRAISETAARGASFGTPTAQENELGELILQNHRYLEKIRFVSSGTEATMSAIRLARGVTGRDKIIKFEGCYHGHADALLVKAGSGLATLGTSTSAGVPEAYARETIVLPLNDLAAVEASLETYKDQVACIIIEPIPANNGLLIQDIDFLRGLRSLCDKTGTLLFFDEVISGFRVGFEGAAGLYGIQPDLLAFGKIIGGGLPVGAYGGSAKTMAHVAPEGPVYQAGTLSGNPVAMAAGYAQLEACLAPNFYTDLATRTQGFVDQVLGHCRSKGYAFNMHRVGSVFWLAFSENIAIRKSSEISPESMEHFPLLYKELLERGVYLGPSGYEVGFVSAAHSQEDLAFAASAFKGALDVVFSK